MTVVRAARRPHLGPARGAGRPLPRLRRRHGPLHPRPGRGAALGAPGTRCRRSIARLAAAGLGLDGAGTPADVVSCPGAESCRLAVTHSRGLGRELEAHVRARPELYGRGAGPRRQGERLPQRLQPAPRRHHRVPGERPQGGRPAGAAVLRAGGRRRLAGRGALRPAGRQDPGPPRGRRRSSGWWRSTRRSGCRGRGPPAFFARLPLERGEGRRWQGPRPSSTPETLAPEDLVDLGEDARVPDRHAGGRVRGLTPAGPPRRPARLRPLHRLHRLLPGAGGAHPALRRWRCRPASLSWAQASGSWPPAPRALASYRISFGASLAAALPEHRLRRAGGLGAGPLPLPRPLAGGRAGGPALRAAHRRAPASPSPPSTPATAGSAGGSSRSASRPPSPRWAWSSRSPSSACPSWCAPCSRCWRTPSRRSRRPRRCWGPSRGQTFLRVLLPALVPAAAHRLHPGLRPRRWASTARWSSSPATCRCAPRSRRCSS